MLNFKSKRNIGDDTSNDYNPLYRDRYQIQMFGRGYIAGMDIQKQRKESGKFYNKLLGKCHFVCENEALYAWDYAVSPLLTLQRPKTYWGSVWSRSRTWASTPQKVWKFKFTVFNKLSPESKRLHSTIVIGRKNRWRQCGSVIGVFFAKTFQFQQRVETSPNHFVTGRSPLLQTPFSSLFQKVILAFFLVRNYKRKL